MSTSESDRPGGPGYDPRYDPAFQRGFSVPDEAPVLARRPMFRDPTASTDAPEDPFAELAAAEQPGDDAGTAAMPAGAEVVLVGNPWVRALWIAGGVLTVAGFSATWLGASARIAVQQPVTDFVTPTVVLALAPVAFLAGLLTLAGAVTLHAATWRRGTAASDRPGIDRR